MNVNLSEETVCPKLEYIRINDEFAPQIIDEKDVPKEFRFGYLNEQLVIEDNSEEYHAEIIRCYKEYRKANHWDIAKKMLAHPVWMLQFNFVLGFFDEGGGCIKSLTIN